MAGIYKITNLLTNEIYIGSSNNIEKRWAVHKCESTWKLQPNSKLYTDFQTFGLQNFEFSVVEECEISELRQREDFYIQGLNPEYNDRRAYNPDCLKNYQKTSETYKAYKKNYQKNYQKTEEWKNYQKNYYSQLCNYNGETLKLSALSQRLSKQGISHPVQEAKKYLVL